MAHCEWDLTGSAPQAPRLQGGVKELKELRFIPIREAPPCGRGASHPISVLRRLLTGHAVSFSVTFSVKRGEELTRREGYSLLARRRKRKM